MTLAVTEDHHLLAETARAVLGRQGGVGPAREATETGGDNRLPASWDEIVALGWLGLAVGEEFGGQGYGVEELAVVIYELGRADAPGPFLPTVWAVAVLDRGGDDAQRRAYLPDLVAGRRHAAVGLDADAVLGGGWADVVLMVEGDDVVILERGTTPAGNEVEVEVLDSLDRTRPLARVTTTTPTTTTTTATATPAGRIAGAAGAARDLGRVLAAAEAAGVASACLDAATGYAKERVQFGRVIGSFQAVKHHLANMAVDTELATAAAWDAARAASVPPDDAGADEQLGLAAAVAATEALAGAVRVARRSIQVHGGIGFTWEHDAHLYLRRATSLRAVFASDPDPAADVTAATRAGIRRASAVALPAEAAAPRASAVAFRERLLALPADQRRAELVASGYLVPHWPAPWGRGAGPVEQLVVDEVLAGVGRPSLGIGGWVTLTIAQHGTPDSSNAGSGPACSASWCSARCSPSPMPAPTRRPSARAAPGSTAGGWSPARRCGPRVPTSPVAGSPPCGPIRTRRSTRASP